MYDGIFEDLHEVEKTLKQAGISDIDETKIFNLLEGLKNPKEVSQILIADIKLNDLESSDSFAGPSAFPAINDFLDDQNESDVEVIKEVRKEDKIRTVDLTDIPDEHFVPDKVFIEKKEPQELDDSWSTTSIAEGSYEESNPDEITNQNDCSNDSDVENYYTTSDYEEPDTDKKETDKTKTESPPPILSILKDLCEYPKIPEIPAQPNVFVENMEMENPEILEENNNDPNNNHDLEEMQMDQPVQRPISPIAGCSRDFNEKEPPKISQSIHAEDSNTSQSEFNLSPKAMKSFFSLESTEPRPSCSKEYNEVEPQSSTENGDEIEEIEVKSSQTNYEQLLEETESITRLFPDMSGDMIFSMLDKYKNASNRVAVVLWELLPREKPEPNFPKKRKQNYVPCPTERKKMSPSGLSSKIDYNTIKKIQNEVRNSEKRTTSELECSSNEESDQNNSELHKLEAKNSDITFPVIRNQQHKDPKGKGKNLLRSCIIQPSKFNFHSNPVIKNEPRPPQKHVILAPPKFIVNPQENQSNFQQVTAKPAKRKVTSPTRELTEEGFIVEGTESVNTAPNVPLSPISKKVEPIKFQPFVIAPKSQYKVEQNSGDALRIKIKKSKSSDKMHQIPVIKGWSDLTNPLPPIPIREIPLPPVTVRDIPLPLVPAREIPLPPVPARDISLPPVPAREIPLSPVPARDIPLPPVPERDIPHPPVSARNHSPPIQNPHVYASMPMPGFQRYDPGLRVTPVANDRATSELENFLNQYLPNDQLEEHAPLDFVNSNRQHQFYQMPRINRPPPYVPLPIINRNSPGPSTSTGNPLKITENLPMVIAGPSANPEVQRTNENTEIPYKDTYYKLRGIFPDVNPEFIKEKCMNPPFNVNGLNKEQQLNMLVEILLTEGTNHYQIQTIQDELASVIDKDVQYENLLEIFPEADPTYLRDFVDKNHHIPDSLKNFVTRNLENPTYPTREEYLKKVKITEQIKQYTTEFDIEKFLQIFPDPVTHFENPSRTNEYNAMVYEFLKDVFRKYKVVTISQIYRKQKHNLSLTAAELRQMIPDMKNKRSCVIIPTENIPVLQEMAYVRYYREIVSYLEDVKIREEKEFKELRAKGMLLECQCCFSDECMPRKCATCEKGHLFCHSCILRGTESKMGDGQNHITCFSSCDSEFSLSVLQEVLPPTTFSILLQKRQEAEVMAAGLEGLVSCPFCHFASIPPPESKVFKCLNPECMKETCRLCKELNHVPLKCDEVMKADQARRHLEEKMTEALVRTCYRCQKQFFKEEGCNKMTCVCGASMCYLCSTPLENEKYSHFNGQGAISSKLCPLWSDNRRMNAEAVRRVAKVTEKEIRKMNPNLQLNAQALLPKLPPKTRGPHDDIPNAYQLPEHIRRIAHINP